MLLGPQCHRDFNVGDLNVVAPNLGVLFFQDCWCFKLWTFLCWIISKRGTFNIEILFVLTIHRVLSNRNSVSGCKGGDIKCKDFEWFYPSPMTYWSIQIPDTKVWFMTYFWICGPDFNNVLKSGPLYLVFRCHSSIGPFNEWTAFNHLNTGVVYYSIWKCLVWSILKIAFDFLC